MHVEPIGYRKGVGDGPGLRHSNRRVVQRQLLGIISSPIYGRRAAIPPPEVFCNQAHQGIAITDERQKVDSIDNP